MSADRKPRIPKSQLRGQRLSQREFLHRILRQDFGTFVHRSFQTVVPGLPLAWNWHLDVMCQHLQACLDGRIKRLIICLPPRHLKSICASVALPAFALGHDPSLRIICASYASDLAGKHARDCRAVMQSDWYHQLFPKTRLDPGKSAEAEFVTTAKGYRLSTSVGGTLTGRGANLLIIDDPLKADDAFSEARRETLIDWFRNTAFSRLDSKADDTIIIVTQRLHPDDLIGHLLADDPDGWTVLNLPAVAEQDEHWALGAGRHYQRNTGEALHPEREGLATLQKIKASLGSLTFSAQYQQNPIPAEGELIKWAWIRTYKQPPERSSEDLLVQSWDTASKSGELNDYSVCTTWLRRGDDHFLLDVLRLKLDYPALKKRVASYAQAWDANTVLIEDKGSGTSLIQDLQHEGQVRPIPMQPDGDKILRMDRHSAKIEAGYVHLPESAGWLDDLKNELLLFPKGRFDDQVDSISQYLDWRDTRATWGPDDIIVVPSPGYQAMCEALGPPRPISDLDIYR